VVDLFEAGAITNRLKAVHPGRIVTSFVNGSRKLYDFVNDNSARLLPFLRGLAKKEPSW
jgi:acyl-CoA hydrolase